MKFKDVLAIQKRGEFWEVHYSFVRPDGSEGSQFAKMKSEQGLTIPMAKSLAKLECEKQAKAPEPTAIIPVDVTVPRLPAVYPNAFQRFWSSVTGFFKRIFRR